VEADVISLNEAIAAQEAEEKLTQTEKTDGQSFVLHKRVEADGSVWKWIDRAE